MTYVLDIRQRRQVTIPAELLEQWKLEEGDKLVVEVEDQKAVLRPRINVAMDTLKELQRVFGESGMGEREFQEAVKKDRKERAKNIKWI